ncbi:MAG: hypothetical protein K2P80_03595 [Beijerinckiaceae bacterium]|nr:hypothetical protein [Beijerinckiaceae bacterium]
MALLGRLFAPPRPRDPIAAERIKGWVRAQMSGDAAIQETIAVTVSEIVCNDVSCPGTETVILIMRPYHTTKAVKLSQPMDQVGEADVVAAMNVNV